MRVEKKSLQARLGIDVRDNARASELEHLAVGVRAIRIRNLTSKQNSAETAQHGATLPTWTKTAIPSYGCRERQRAIDSRRPGVQTPDTSLLHS